MQRQIHFNATETAWRWYGSLPFGERSRTLNLVIDEHLAKKEDNPLELSYLARIEEVYLECTRLQRALRTLYEAAQQIEQPTLLKIEESE